MKIRKAGLTAAAALTLALSAPAARADLQGDLLSAWNAGSGQARMAALSSLASANAGNYDRFLQIVSYVAVQATDETAAAYAKSLASACGAVGNSQAVTGAIVSSFVSIHPGAGGDVFASVVGAGCDTQVAANSLQSALSSAAGQVLSRVSVLPPNTPGTGVDLLQNPGNIKEQGLTTRLGNDGTLQRLSRDIPRTTEPPMSSSSPTDTSVQALLQQ
jgi:hypothetical protein